MNLQITGKKVQTTPVITKKTIAEPKKVVKAPPKINQPKVKSSIKPSFSVTNNKQRKEKKTEEVKKQQSPLKEQKVEIKEEKVEEPQPELQTVKHQDVISQVTIRYNHYKQQFECRNGILSFVPIEQKYSFGNVFKGNFLPVLKKFRTVDEIPPETTGLAVEYSWKVEENGQYQLCILQDEEQESKYERKAYKAPVQQPKCNKNKKVDELTQQMKKMGISELGSDKHKEMLEQRDLEDILFK